MKSLREACNSMLSTFSLSLYFLILLSLGVFYPQGSMAISIEGVVTEIKGREKVRAQNAMVILQRVTGDREGKTRPTVELTDKEGKFQFLITEQEKTNKFKLIVYKNERIKMEEIDLRGQSEKLIPITIGKYWYEMEWLEIKLLDKVWTLFSLVISFFLGLFSNRLLEGIKIGKNQKIITAIYNDSIGEFVKEVNNIEELGDEKKYSTIQEKFSLAKSNIEKLLNYSWAVEKMKPSFFQELQMKMYLIQKMEKTIPFDPAQSIVIKLTFLKNFRGSQAGNHQEFAEIFNNLKIT